MGLELKTNTAVRITVGPLVDPTDGKTAETGLTVTDLSVQIYQIKTDGSAVVRTQFAPTASGGNNDMVLVTSSTDGMYDLELTAAQLNFLGNARITFYDVDAFLVHWIDLQIVSANYFDNKFGSTIETVNVTQLGSSTQSATDLKDFADEGYDPATNKVQGVVLTDTVTTLTGHTAQTADHTAAIADIPTVSEFNARTLPSADYVVTTDTIAGVTTATNLTNAPTSGDLTATMKASVNAEVLDVLNTDTFAEPGDEAPAATTTLVGKIGYLYKFLRNKIETTSTRIHVYDDAGTNKDHSSVISDNGTTFTRGEFGAGDA
jgi:hypothetical protein